MCKNVEKMWKNVEKCEKCAGDPFSIYYYYLLFVFFIHPNYSGKLFSRKLVFSRNKVTVRQCICLRWQPSKIRASVDVFENSDR